MTIKKIRGVYFSPAGATKEVLSFLVMTLAEKLQLPYEIHSYTYPKERAESFSFEETDMILWASPVYAGRIPNKTRDYVSSAIVGNSALAVAVVTFGNRSFDNGLSELTSIMEESGCRMIGAAALSCRHSFSDVLGSARPDEKDRMKMEAFCEALAEKIQKGSFPKISVPGEAHPQKYYVPKRTDGQPAVFLKARPKLKEENCISCGGCKDVCPMGSITYDEKPQFTGICIKCQACRRSCKEKAIYFDDPDFLSHVHMVEENFQERKEPQFFI